MTREEYNKSADDLRVSSMNEINTLFEERELAEKAVMDTFHDKRKAADLKYKMAMQKLNEQFKHK